MKKLIAFLIITFLFLQNEKDFWETQEVYIKITEESETNRFEPLLL